ncbi:hypothetical protein [Dactylosporangium sp. NPDC048998]|uniref:hypothetical protein n=1 Tax=Dactylosporangium sp. NPDC048998 TaxID=3363976 RepID=UPI0037223FFF
MLAPDTVRTLTVRLLAAAEPDPLRPETAGLDPSAPVHPAVRAGRDARSPSQIPSGPSSRYALLVVHDGAAPDTPPGTRRMSCIAVAIHPQMVEAYRGGLPDLLADLAAAVYPSGQAAETGLSKIIRRGAADVLADAFAAPEPDMRLLACAVSYDDIHIGDTQTTDARTGDAGEQTNRSRDGADHTDSRVAVLPVRRVDAVDIDGRVYQAVRHPGGHTTVLVDDEPDPLDTPATHPGLTALLTTAVHATATAPTAGDN